MVASVLKGIYTLVIKLNKPRTIIVGKLGRISFSARYYVYVGSAFNGLEARIARHLRKEKKLHWHLDYFLKKARVEEIFYSVTMKHKECAVALGLAKKLSPIPNFGSSDCRCLSHLYFSSGHDRLGETINRSFTRSGLVPSRMTGVSFRGFSDNKTVS